MWEGMIARRKSRLLRSVSRLVGPVRSATARGGKRMLHVVIISRLKRGMRIFFVRWTVGWEWLDFGSDHEVNELIWLVS